MKITILLGSVRQGRHTHKVAFYLEQLLKIKGAEVNLIDLAKDVLPPHGFEISAQQTDIIDKMSHQLSEADGLIFVTPEYHGTFSGVLKNALEYFWSEFTKKPIGVVSVSSGQLGGINASTQLQHVILSLGAFPMPVKLLVSEVQTFFNDSNQPNNERVSKAADRFLNEFLWFTDAIYQKRIGHQLKESA